ncbi:MAG: PHP domain-containing protein [Peptostreptococcaceae bacterium]|nr:PHP domain-containing protein [Peptostreptococcaceae bacterium]
MKLLLKIYADYHTHTYYSDGKSTIEDNVKIAIARGLKTIGISDHGYKHYYFGVKYDNYAKIRAEIDALKEKYKNIEILMGTECNILDDKGNIDLDEHIASLVDYVIAGYHFGSKIYSLRSGANLIGNYLKPLKFTQVEYNTRALINAMKNNDLFILAHPGDKGDVAIEEVAKIAMETNTILEINERHHNLTLEQLLKIKDYDLKFILSSDAHLAQNVGKVDGAIKRILASGLDLDKVVNIIK